MSPIRPIQLSYVTKDSIQASLTAILNMNSMILIRSMKEHGFSSNTGTSVLSTCTFIVLGEFQAIYPSIALHLNALPEDAVREISENVAPAFADAVNALKKAWEDIDVAFPVRRDENERLIAHVVAIDEAKVRLSESLKSAQHCIIKGLRSA